MLAIIHPNTGQLIGGVQAVQFTQYQTAIAEVKATSPDYTRLEALWHQFNTEAFEAAYQQRYGEHCPPKDILSGMVEIDVQSRRRLLSADEFKTELDSIHKGTVDAAVQQLEFERDNPEKQDQPAGVGDQFEKFFGDFATAVGHWLEDRFKSSFDGANNESGFGAKILRGGLGISWEDLKSRGLLGGDNSYLRKIIPTWSDGGGFFGGENSFFRKPFG